MRESLDRKTFDGLVLEHLVAAQRFAIRLTGNPDAAEDVVQDALLRASKAWQSFRGESRFQTWLFQIVVNAFRDYYARQSARASPGELPEQILDPRAADPLAGAASAEEGERIARVVSSLPARQREVVVLHAFEGLSSAEIARVLNISEQNVRTNLAFARRRLRELLLRPAEDRHE